MQQAFTDFLSLIQNELYYPLYRALQNSGALNQTYIFITNILNAILGTELNPIPFGANVIASMISIIVIIYSIFFVIKLIKSALYFVVNIFDDQFAFSGRRRRKRK